jgi:hypothetical protein
MPGIMTGGAAHSGSLQTSLCICRRDSGEGEYDSSYSHHKFHLGLHLKGLGEILLMYNSSHLFERAD